MHPSTFVSNLSLLQRGQSFSIRIEQAKPARVQGDGHARPDLHVGHVEAFADRDECPFASGIEIKERVAAERLDQPDRQLDVALAAAADADVLRPDTERGRPRLRRLEAVRQGELEARAAKPDRKSTRLNS